MVCALDQPVTVGDWYTQAHSSMDLQNALCYGDGQLVQYAAHFCAIFGALAVTSFY